MLNIMKKSIKQVFPQLWIEAGLHLQKKHFEQELFLIPLLCDKKHIAVDVGANQGIYTYVMSKYADVVIAFEPNARLHEALKKAAGGNVIVKSEALWDTPGVCTMRIDPTNDGISTIEHKNAFQAANPEVAHIETEVLTNTLDSFRLSAISLIKIDVEGHEEAVILGGWRTLSRNLPFLIIESENQHNLGAPERVRNLLARLGYRGFYIKDRQLRPFEELESGDAQASNWDRGLPYINNFIYVPQTKAGMIERLQQAALFLR